MKFEIYHQLGHNYVWNIDSITKDKAGDGIIVGPRNIEREKVEKLPKNLRRRAIFDPQFFLPSVARGKLSTYPFFPQIYKHASSFGGQKTSQAVSSTG